MVVESGQIVVGVDGSPHSSAAVKWAAREAQLHNSALTLVHVIAPESGHHSTWAGVPVYPDHARLQREKVSAYESLATAQRTAMDAVGPRDGLRVHHEVLVGPVAQTLAACAQHADLLAVGCDNRNAFARALFGSTSSELIHHARCALAFIHHDDSPTTRSPEDPVLVGVDGTTASEPALEVAFDESSRRGVGLIAFHAWNDEGPIKFGRPGHAPIEWANMRADEEQFLGKRLVRWSARYPQVSVRRIVASERPVPGLLRWAEKAQLLVLGSHGDRLTDKLHRSVRSAVVAASQIPVIIAERFRPA